MWGRFYLRGASNRNIMVFGYSFVQLWINQENYTLVSIQKIFQDSSYMIWLITWHNEPFETIYKDNLLKLMTWINCVIYIYLMGDMTMEHSITDCTSII